MSRYLSVEEFGRILFETEDLDPLYVALVGANLDGDLMRKWLVAYWLFYHVGVSSDIASADDFWDRVIQLHDTAPRGTERRHFRGRSSRDAIEVLSYFDPVSLVDDIIGEEPTAESIGRQARLLPQFGPWISWKIADMVDRVLNITVDFSEANVAIYGDVVKAATMVSDRWGEDFGLDEVIERLLRAFTGHLAPPFYDRPINIQEIETVLCKIKSHWHNHYPLGKDTVEIYHGFHGWGDLAEHIQSFVPIHLQPEERRHGL